MDKNNFANIEEGSIIHTVNKSMKTGYVVLKKNQTTLWCTTNLPKNQWNFNALPLYKGIKPSAIESYQEGDVNSSKILDAYKSRTRAFQAVTIN